MTDSSPTPAHAVAPVTAGDDRGAMRTALRARRRALTGRARHRAEYQLAMQVLRLRALHQAQRIGAYLAAGAQGEVEVSLLIEWALRAGKAVYVPVMRADRHLDFARFTPSTRLAGNRFGLDEPVPAQRELVAPMHLDVVLTPLVGFDARGNRLGMGGGYYDRTFAPLLARRAYRRPRLLGIAFDCQRVAGELVTEPWDVPLWQVVTERGRYPRAPR